MATTVVYPSLDVSGTGSISTIIATAGTFTGSLTASTLAVTGTATFSGTAVFLTTAQFLGTVTFSATVAFLTSVQISGTLSVGNIVLPASKIIQFGNTASFGVSFRHSVSASQAFIDVLTFPVPDNTGVGWFRVYGRTASNGMVIALSRRDDVAALDFTFGVAGVAGHFYPDSLPGDACLAAQATTNILMGHDSAISSTFRQSAGGAVFKQNLGVSGTASVGSLVVNGTASLSGTAVFLTTANFLATASYSIAPQVGGFPLAWNKLGSANGATSTQFKISGAWTNYDSLQLVVNGKGAATTTNLILFLYTDGGTTPLMTYATVAAGTATASDFVAVFDIFGVNVSGLKVVKPLVQHFAGVTTQGAQTQSATTTTAALNCIGITAGTATTTRTMSAATVYLYGRAL